MSRTYRIRIIGSIIMLLLVISASVRHQPLPSTSTTPTSQSQQSQTAVDQLSTLAVKGRAAKTGYERSQFGDGWRTVQGCSTREIILARDLKQVITDSTECRVLSGVLHDPYTAKTIAFTRGAISSQAVQIDHVVALSNAWQTGAQQVSKAVRVQFANDPLNLLAVEGAANEQKSDADAATWLPPNKSFRCTYVMRQVAVKHTYALWVTKAEKSAMLQVLRTC